MFSSNFSETTEREFFCEHTTISFTSPLRGVMGVVWASFRISLDLVSTETRLSSLQIWFPIHLADPLQKKRRKKSIWRQKGNLSQIAKMTCHCSQKARPLPIVSRNQKKRINAKIKTLVTILWIRMFWDGKTHVTIPWMKFEELKCIKQTADSDIWTQTIQRWLYLR